MQGDSVDIMAFPAAPPGFAPLAWPAAPQEVVAVPKAKAKAKAAAGLPAGLHCLLLLELIVRVINGTLAN